MKRLGSYLYPLRWQMCLQFFIKFVGTVMDLALPIILTYLIDHVVPVKNTRAIFWWGALMLLCSALALAGNVVANRMASQVARDVTLRLRHDLYEHISRFSCEQVDAFSVSTLESRLTSDTYNLQRMLGMMQRIGLRAPILVLGSICISFAIEPVLTLALVAVLPPIAGVVYLVNKKGGPQYLSTQQKVDDLVRTVRENCTGVRIIKALCKSSAEKVRFDGANRQVVAHESRASATMTLIDPSINLILRAGLVLVILLAAFRVNDGAAKAGAIVAIISYFTIILNALASINRVFTMYSRGTASAKRIDEVMSVPLPLAPAALPDEPDSPWHISCEHLSFSYQKGKPDVSDVSFHLKKGQTLGIIGPTGCGKSTILTLLLRFYEADGGCVRIDGKDIRDIALPDLRSRFGVVFQNDLLFSETAGENISFERDIGAEDQVLAARCAQADFLFAAGAGLGYPIEAHGANLSGGQKQRVLIARALATKPSVLILDDSSSALDYQTDANLRRALEQTCGEMTKIIVAQRVSSLRDADCILMMNEGRVIGRGTHRELMASCADYRQIAEMQMGGEDHA